jgi:hypothetical protein
LFLPPYAKPKASRAAGTTTATIPILEIFIDFLTFAVCCCHRDNQVRTGRRWATERDRCEIERLAIEGRAKLAHSISTGLKHSFHFDLPNRHQRRPYHALRTAASFRDCRVEALVRSPLISCLDLLSEVTLAQTKSNTRAKRCEDLGEKKLLAFGRIPVTSQ